MIRDDKRGFIASEAPSIFARLGIKPDKWLAHVRNFAQKFDLCWGKGKCVSSDVYLASST